MGAFAALRIARPLHNIMINLQGTCVGEARLWVLMAALREAPALRTFTFAGGGLVEEAGLHALATLRDAPLLDALTLELSCNQDYPVSSSTVRALALLATCAIAVQAEDWHLPC